MITPKSCGHARICTSQIQSTYIRNHVYDNPYCIKSDQMPVNEEESPVSQTISMVDHCQHGPAPQNSSVGSLNLLSCLPRSQSTTRKTISVLGSNQGPVHKHTSAVSGRCMYSTPEQRKAPAIYGTSYCRHLASNGHLFGEKNHERSKNSTPAIGISAVPARHKSESPWRNHGGLCRLHLLTLTWIMIPWAKWTLNSCH